MVKHNKCFIVGKNKEGARRLEDNPADVYRNDIFQTKNMSLSTIEYLLRLALITEFSSASLNSMKFRPNWSIISLT